MKKTLIYVAMIAIAGVTTTGCASSKEAKSQKKHERELAEIARQQEIARARDAGRTIGGTTNIPCIDHDTDEYYVGVYSVHGGRNQLGELGTQAQNGARQQLIQKMANTYNGFVEQSANREGNNRGNDVTVAMKSAGLDIIRQEVGRTRATCGPLASEHVDDNGNIMVYVALRMYVKDIVKALADNLTQDQKSAINMDHDEAMRKLQEYMNPKK